MGQEKHTPGPWLLGDNTGRDYQRTIIANDSGRVEAVAVVDLDELPAAEDNARLIASAPELLEVARALVAWASEVPEPYRRWPFVVQAAEVLARIDAPG